VSGFTGPGEPSGQFSIMFATGGPVGKEVGLLVGLGDGASVGIPEWTTDGAIVGLGEGARVGMSEWVPVGPVVGAKLGSALRIFEGT
jgi:hypothetical protein